MKRQLQAQLVEWKSQKNRKPLILQGARQVGKTYLLKAFAEQSFSGDYIYINFDYEPQFAKFFDKDLDPVRILKDIGLYLKKTISPDETLLILDEVQECPAALNSLKYFCENSPRTPVIAAGSLLGVKLSQQESFPVGKVDFLSLKPMSFFEFLLAVGRDDLYRQLQDVEAVSTFVEPVHTLLLDLLKQYFIVGGMPEAVQSFVDHQDFSLVRQIQHNILDGYTADFAKHATSTDVMKIMDIWHSIPAQLAKENRKFQFAKIKKVARAREYDGALQWLLNAGLVYQSHRVETANFPLKAHRQPGAFKLFMHDVGLLGCLSELSAKIIIDGNALFTQFKGALTENFVAQELMVERGVSLYYWAHSDKAELDFLLNDDNDIVPLEVKAGESVSSKSLQYYAKQYHPQKIILTSSLAYKHKEAFTRLPLYAICNWQTFLQALYNKQIIS